MVIKASNKDKKEVYSMWKNIFSHDDGGYTDYYFNVYYESLDTFVKKVDDEVVGCASKHSHEVVFNERLLKCSMIVGVAVKEEYRQKGYMNEMMQAMLDEANHQELITMIQAYDPNIYSKYGFETVYFQRVWNIKKENIKKIRPQVTRIPNALDCLKLYGKFVSRFSGYYIRDLNYFEKYIKEVTALKGKIISYYNKDELEGYAVVYEDNNVLEIKECIYLNSTALLHIFNYFMYKDKEIYLYTSSAENMSLIFPNCEYKEVPYTMVRLNDAELFNRLYNCDVKNAKEAMNILEKPLFLSESR